MYLCKWKQRQDTGCVSGYESGFVFIQGKQLKSYTIEDQGGEKIKENGRRT